MTAGPLHRSFSTAVPRLLVATVLLASCAQSGPPAPAGAPSVEVATMASTPEPTVPATGAQAVGRLLVDGEGACTATAISPQKILTAAHCLGEPPRPELAVFIMNSVDYGIDGMHRGGKVRAGGKAPLETIRRDWAVLALAPTSPAVGPHPSVPLSGLEEAKSAMQRQAPLKKAGFVFDPTGAASLGATADCRIRAIDPTGETFLFTCGQKGLGPGMSGSPLLVDGPEGEIVIGLQSAAVDLEGELFGVAVIPPPAAHAPIP